MVSSMVLIPAGSERLIAFSPRLQSAKKLSLGYLYLYLYIIYLAPLKSICAWSKLMILVHYGAKWPQEARAFEFHQQVFKNVT